MVCRMRTDRERQAMAIDNRHDFHAFSALRGSDLRPAALGHNESCVDEAFFFVERAAVAKVVGNIRQHSTQNFIAAPSLKSPMHSFVVRIALRQHVPLRAGVENPQHRFKYPTRRNPYGSSTIYVSDQHRRLLLRPAKSVAARFQREHQSSIETVLPEGNRLVGILANSSKQSGASAQ